MKRLFAGVILASLIGFAPSANAQETITKKETTVVSKVNNATITGENNLTTTNAIAEEPKFKKHGKFGFFFTGGYSFGLDENTDAEGRYLPNGSEEATNDFFIRYARINGAYHITPKLKANLLFNLADFSRENLNRRVFEIASVTYQFNPMLNLRVGQFRPYFGVEDTYGVGNNLSYYWSNTYLVMGGSHWQSFQIGASLYGNLNKKNIPLKYYLNVYNGNGKNQLTDNDSNKNISGRLALTAIPGVELGANYAIAKHLGENTNAYAFDFKTNHNLSDRWTLNSEFNYATGHNIKDAIKLNVAAENLDGYKFSGWYITPQVVYKLNKPNLNSIAFSCRYESLNSNKEIDNIRTTITPMVDFNISKDFKASVVAILNDYEEENIDSGLMDTQLMQIQLQFNY